MTDLLCALEPLFDRNTDLDSEFLCDRFNFTHDSRGQRARFGAFNYFDQGRAS